MALTCYIVIKTVQRDEAMRLLKLRNSAHFVDVEDMTVFWFDGPAILRRAELRAAKIQYAFRAFHKDTVQCYDHRAYFYDRDGEEISERLATNEDEHTCWYHKIAAWDRFKPDMVHRISHTLSGLPDWGDPVHHTAMARLRQALTN